MSEQPAGVPVATQPEQEIRQETGQRPAEPRALPLPLVPTITIKCRHDCPAVREGRHRNVKGLVLEDRAAAGTGTRAYSVGWGVEAHVG